MSFLFPTFLWALVAAIAIPVIIHLFQFRRFKKVWFTNVRMLKEVKEERANRTKIKYWLVLASRILALSLLVFAFAQPFIPKSDDQKVVQGDKHISVYLDNSFSMDARLNDVSLFEKGRAKAREIVAAYGPNDRFQIITNDFEGKHQRLLNKEEFVGYLDELKISPNVQNLSNVIERQKQLLEQEEAAEKSIFLLSDFQENLFDFSNDTSYRFYMVPLQASNQQNLFIDSVWFESPVQILNKTSKLLVKLKNAGDSKVENARMTLKLNGQVKALKDINLLARAEKIDTINFSTTQAGWNKAELHITDYPISFDDTYYFTFNIDEEIKILTIHQNKVNKGINALFTESELMTIDNQAVNNINYANFPTYRLIILDDLDKISSGLAAELIKFLADGGSLSIFPSKNADLSTYNAFFNQISANTFTAKSTENRSINKINLNQEVFKGVFDRLDRNLDLPTAQQSFESSNYTGTNAEKLLRFVDGSAAVTAYRYKQGKVYVSNLPLNADASNMASHSIFVPMLHKMALVGGDSKTMAFTIGKDNLIEVPFKEKLAAESVVKLKSENEEFIPGQKATGSQLVLSLNNMLKKDGLYALQSDENTQHAHLGFNYDRKESLMDYMFIDDLKNKLKDKNIQFLEKIESDFAKLVGELDKGIVLWKWCLIGALLFLLIEMLLLRFWRE